MQQVKQMFDAHTFSLNFAVVTASTEGPKGRLPQRLQLCLATVQRHTALVPRKELLESWGLWHRQNPKTGNSFSLRIRYSN